MNRKEMCRFDLTVSKINENVNTVFISPVTLTSYFDVALNKRNAGQESVFCVWLFSCNDLMSLDVRKRFLRFNVIYRLQLNVQRNCRRQRRRKELQFQYSSNFG